MVQCMFLRCSCEDTSHFLCGIISIYSIQKLLPTHVVETRMSWIIYVRHPREIVDVAVGGIAASATFRPAQSDELTLTIGYNLELSHAA